MKMMCTSNRTYENCLTVGKVYDVGLEAMYASGTMYHLIDDNDEALQTMLNLFELLEKGKDYHA